MLSKVWIVASFGGRYMAAAVTYTGLTLAIAGIMPPASNVYAFDECETCSSGEQCCHGQCIPDDHICCDDGTSGPATIEGGGCLCCTGCESECSSSSTYVCAEGEES